MDNVEFWNKMLERARVYGEERNAKLEEAIRLLKELRNDGDVA